MCKFTLRSCVNTAAVVGLMFLAAGATGQTTAFTYQGAMTESGVAATGSYQFQFKLFNAVNGGAQVGSTITDVPLAVVNGIFGATLDFGSNVFGGADRFLEIAVRHNAQETYTLLPSRQQITSSPYAIRTLSAQQADIALDSQKLGGVAASEYITNTSAGSSFIRNQTSQQASSNFNISGNGIVAGNIGVGIAAPGARVDALTASGDAVKGISTTNGRGVWGQSDSWQGVFGKSNTQAGVVGDSNSFYGVFGVTSGVSASGIYGSNSAAGGTAIIGQSNAGKGVYGSATNGGVGVWGESNAATGFGVRGFGLAFNTTGVKGESNLGQGIGVWGQGDVNTGVYGLTATGTGVYGRSTATNGLGRAMYADGNAGQAFDKGGFVKAMVYVMANGTIERCYNGVTNVWLAGGGASTTGCGFSAGPISPTTGWYTVTFDFDISQRYFTFTPHGGQSKAGYIVTYGTNSVIVSTAYVDQGRLDDGVLSDFFLIVY